MKLVGEDRGTPDSAGRAYGGVAASDRVAERRARLLDAGLQLFGTAGYQATTVKALCREAGLSERYFYESFANTEALLIAVYERSTDEMYQRMYEMVAAEGAADTGTDAGFERLVTDTLTAFFATIEDPRVLRVCWLEILGVSPTVDATYIDGIDRFASFVAATIESKVSGADHQRTRVLSTAIVGAVINTAVRWLLEGQAEPTELLVDVNAMLLLGGVDRLAASTACR